MKKKPIRAIVKVTEPNHICFGCGVLVTIPAGTVKPKGKCIVLCGLCRGGRP